MKRKFQKSCRFYRVWSSHAQDRLPSIRKMKETVRGVAEITEGSPLVVDTKIHQRIEIEITERKPYSPFSDPPEYHESFV